MPQGKNLRALKDMYKELIWSTAPSPLKTIIKKLHNLKFFLLIPIIFLILLFSVYIFFLDKIYPQVKVSGIDLGGLTQEQAKEKLSQTNFPNKLQLMGDSQVFEFDTNNIDAQYDISKTVEKAYAIGHKPYLFNLEDIKSLFLGVNLTFSYSIDTDKLDAYLDSLSHEISIPAVDPTMTIVDKQVNVATGKNGQDLDILSLKKQIFENLAYAKSEPIHMPINQITPQITDDEAQEIKQKAQNLIDKQVSLTFEDQNFIYKDSDLLALLEPIQPGLLPNTNKINDLVKSISQTINRDPQNAKLTYEDGKVKEFQPAKDGIAVKEDELAANIADSLDKLETTGDKEENITIPVDSTKPDVSTDEVNNLGIKELIGRGESYYKGSISSRIHNLSLAASKLNGQIIKPGEEFSFNKAIGEVSQLTGYEQAYVIKEGHTILDDGGGVCQVSTTFFRAALNTGLPILERHQHSYRVSYYEQGTKLGIDAAIYQPGTDLRIKNDTPANILIVTKNDVKSSHLVFEFYGTSDGRVSEISNIRSWDPVPAPPDLYQDDPTLPVGTIKQVEHSIPGIKAAFDYKVIRNGELLQNRTFTSNYQAWQAVYLRGTAQ